MNEMVLFLAMVLAVVTVCSAVLLVVRWLDTGENELAMFCGAYALAGFAIVGAFFTYRSFFSYLF